VRREMVAGVLPKESPTRSGRVLRSLVLVGLKLMVTDLPPALFTCLHCLDADGRYKYVSADSIWVGFGSGADHVHFQHVVEAVPENERAINAAYLVRGESVRRMLRDVMKPTKDVKVCAKAVKAAEIAVGILLPDALPAQDVWPPTDGERAVSALLGSIYDIRSASSKLLSALKTGLSTYKTRSPSVAERRTKAAAHLLRYISATATVKPLSDHFAGGTAASARDATNELPPTFTPSTAQTPPPSTGYPAAAPPPATSPPAAAAAGLTSAPTTTGQQPPPPTIDASTSQPPPPSTGHRAAAPPPAAAPPAAVAAGLPSAPTPTGQPPPPPTGGLAAVLPRAASPLAAAAAGLTSAPTSTGQAPRPPTGRPVVVPPRGASPPAAVARLTATQTGKSHSPPPTTVGGARVPPPRGPPRGGGPLTLVAPQPATPTGKRKRGRNSVNGEASAARQTTRRRPACGRQPFKAGKGEVEDGNPHLQAAIAELDKDGRRELLSFVNAITIDSVVLPFRPHHAGTLRMLAKLPHQEDGGDAVREVLGMATSGVAIAELNEKKPIVELLRELRFMQLGVRTSASLFKALSMLPTALGRGLHCVADAIDKFVLEWSNGPAATLKYEKRWKCGERSQKEMSKAFQEAYPQATTHHEQTGTCAPGLPQCRPEPFLWQEVLRTGMCSKHYAKAHKFSPGAMTFCCGCQHPLILAFTVLDRKEAPQVLLNMLLTRFARLPHFLIYDFACGAFRVALGKLGWLLMDCTVVSDRFHIFNHLCSDAFDPRSYKKMDGADTGAPEQRNAPIRRIQTTLQGMGVEPYTNLLAYQTAILNHEAQAKWELGVDRLSEDVDLAGMYFARFPCLCCDDSHRASIDEALPEAEVSEGDTVANEGLSDASGSTGSTGRLWRVLEEGKGRPRDGDTDSDEGSAFSGDLSASEGGGASGASERSGEMSIGLSE